MLGNQRSFLPAARRSSASGSRGSAQRALRGPHGRGSRRRPAARGGPRPPGPPRRSGRPGPRRRTRRMRRGPAGRRGHAPRLAPSLAAAKAPGLHLRLRAQGAAACGRPRAGRVRARGPGRARGPQGAPPRVRPPWRRVPGRCPAPTSCPASSNLAPRPRADEPRGPSLPPRLDTCRPFFFSSVSRRFNLFSLSHA